MSTKIGDLYYAENALWTNGLSGNRIGDCVREVAENQSQYNGTMSKSDTVYDDDNKEAWLIQITNSEHFGSAENIMRNGLTPNESGDKGASRYGSGKTLQSLQMSSESPCEIIASKTATGWSACIGKPIPRQKNADGGWESGYLYIGDETEALMANIRRLVDLQSFEDAGFTNIFMCRKDYLDLNQRREEMSKRKPRTDGEEFVTPLFMTESMGTDMMFDTDATAKVKLIYDNRCHVINDSLDDKSDLGVKQHLGRITCTTSEGNNTRVVLDKQTYIDRYCKPEDRFVIKDVDFETEIDDKTYVLSGDIECYIFEGKKKDGGSRLVDLTGGEPRGGHRPNNLTYLYLEGLNDVADEVKHKKDIRNAYARFSSNSVAKFAGNFTKMMLARMGCQYKPATKPFTLLLFKVKKFVGEKSAGGTETNPITIEAMERKIGLRPDFRLSSVKAKKILECFASSAKAKVEKIMVDRHKELHPISEVDTTPFCLADAVTRKSMTGSTGDLTHGYDLERKGHHNGKFKPGSSKLVAIYYNKIDNWLPINITSHSDKYVSAELISAENLEQKLKDRGHHAKERRELMAYHNELRRRFSEKEPLWYEIKVVHLARLNKTTGEYEKFKVEKDGAKRRWLRADLLLDWDDKVQRKLWNITNPQIRSGLEGSSKSTMIGRIEEIPIRERVTPPPPPKPKPGEEEDESKSTSSEGKGESCSKLSVWCDPPRPSHIIMEWDGVGGPRGFKMNPKHERWVHMAGYADNPEVDVKIYKLQNEGIYQKCAFLVSDIAAILKQTKLKFGASTNEIAGCELDMSKLAELHPGEGKIAPDLDTKSEGYTNDVTDYLLNRVLERAFQNGFLSDEFKELEKLRKEKSDKADK